MKETKARQGKKGEEMRGGGDIYMKNEVEMATEHMQTSFCSFF